MTARERAAQRAEIMFNEAVHLWNDLLEAHTGDALYNGVDFPEMEQVEAMQRLLRRIAWPQSAE